MSGECWQEGNRETEQLQEQHNLDSTTEGATKKKELSFATHARKNKEVWFKMTYITMIKWESTS